MAVVIPHDFERRLQSDTRAGGADPGRRLATQPRGSGRRHRRDAASSRATAKARIPAANAWRRGASRSARLYNPEKRTAVQIVPALIGVILSMTMVLFTSGAIVRERERGNLELLIATPLGRPRAHGGQTTAVRRHRPDPDHDHPDRRRSACSTCPSSAVSLNLYAAALMFIAATLGLGLFVSTLAQTQFQAFQLAFLTLLPSILLSGFMFPFEGMPVVAQWIAQVLPLTHFNVIIRGVMLRGADLPEVWPQTREARGVPHGDAEHRRRALQEAPRLTAADVRALHSRVDLAAHGNSMKAQAERAQRFRALHAKGTFVIANCWDGGSAQILASLGFPALATSSGAAAGTLGRLDHGISIDESLANARTDLRLDHAAGVGGSRERIWRRAGRHGEGHPHGRRRGPRRRLDRRRHRPQGRADLRSRTSPPNASRPPPKPPARCHSRSR